MTTYDTTVSMLKKLPERDLKKVLCFVRDTFFGTGEYAEEATADLNPFCAVTEDEVLNRLEDCRRRIDNGEELHNAHYASSFVRKKYGIK